MNGFLVIVSCGSQKVWDRYPGTGPTAARDAYTSSVFKTSRRYAEQFAERWLILSAKYGLIDPHFMIPSTYNCSFYDRDAIAVRELIEQVKTKNLGVFKIVGVLGSNEYWNRVVKAFEHTACKLHHVNGNVGFPPLFQRMIGDLITRNTPFDSGHADTVVR